MSLADRVAASLVLVLVLVLCAPTGMAQDSASPANEEYKIYTEAPRIFLRPQRQRLIRRERERETIRWQQFHLLMSGKARMPEPGFASALYYRTGAGDSHAADAAAWAALPASQDVRQLAIVYDWCEQAMSPTQKSAVEAKLRKALAGTGASVAAIHARALSAAALAGVAPEATEAAMRFIIRDWWRGRIAPALLGDGGETAVRREELPLLFEILHVVRDNTNIDLRDDARRWFKSLPSRHLLSHYPAPMSLPENEFRIPAYSQQGEPDIKDAALSRATDFMMVAYDPNVLENQFVQGWLMQDRYLMRGPFGITYEYLWANPYQPGLSVFKLEPFFHDEAGGGFFVRSSWDEDAEWFGMFDGKMQLFQNGGVTQLNQGALAKPLRLGQSTLMSGHAGMRFKVEEEEKSTYFLFGMEKNARYDVEVDNEGMFEAKADGGGILELAFAANTRAGVRIKKAKQLPVSRGAGGGTGAGVSGAAGSGK